MDQYLWRFSKPPCRWKPGTHSVRMLIRVFKLIFSAVSEAAFTDHVKHVRTSTCFEEASCPRRWSYPYSISSLYSPLPIGPAPAVSPEKNIYLYRTATCLVHDSSNADPDSSGWDQSAANQTVLRPKIREWAEDMAIFTALGSHVSTRRCRDNILDTLY